MGVLKSQLGLQKEEDFSEISMGRKTLEVITMFAGLDNLSRSFSEQANEIFGSGNQEGPGDYRTGNHGGPNLHQQQTPPQTDGAPPPAALSFINNLRETTITSDDLIEENNKECLICLDEHALGGKAVKLPCGHLYHRDCVIEWLQKQGSCPVCRYEVESSDAMYEMGRKKRMQTSRKMRMRKNELKAKKVSELRNIARQLSIVISGCIDKSEITDIMIASGKFDFTEGVPVQNIDEDVFRAMSVRELRQLLLSFGISDEGMLDKEELRSALVESGRIALVRNQKGEEEADMQIDADPAVCGGEEESHAACKMPPSPLGVGNNSASSDSAPSVQIEAQSRGGDATRDAPSRPADPNVLELGPDLVRNLSVRELKDIMSAYSISADGCLEREDLLRRLGDHPGVHLPGEER